MYATSMIKSDNGLAPGAEPSGANAQSNADPGTESGAGSSSKPRGTNAKGLASDVCDHCRTRRVRCDYRSPCGRCQDYSLTCTRNYVPRKRGPKRGQGRVIKQLRAQEAKDRGVSAGDTAAEFERGSDDGPLTPATSNHSSPSCPRKGSDAAEQYRPTGKSYVELVPKCVDLYYEHIYPIMPLLYMPDIRDMLQRPLQPSEQTLLYALSAKTCFHMRGNSLKAEGPDCWERAGRFFLDECESTRKTFDYVKTLSLFSVITSFWMSTSSFEINDNWKSEFYMREALNFALGLRLHHESSYVGLSPEESLCRRRSFWQLFVTERSLAIFRRQDILFRRTPKLPTTRHYYESPDIHSGFLQLISAYEPLDESFVRAWNDGPDAGVSLETFLNLQNTLAEPPSFVSHPRSSRGSVIDAKRSSPVEGRNCEDAIDTPEPTIIQKADLLITQQWLRLTVWHSSGQRFLLSRDSPNESMRFSFPLAIAHRTASILKALPSRAIEAHGMGILEKIFEIGHAWVGIMDAYNAVGSSISSGKAPFGMDFAKPGSDLGVLGVSRMGTTIDPLGLFVDVLSTNPDSKVQFAGPLLRSAREKPGVMRMALTPPLRAQETERSGSAGTPLLFNSGDIIDILGETSNDSSSPCLPIATDTFESPISESLPLATTSALDVCHATAQVELTATAFPTPDHPLFSAGDDLPRPRWPVFGQDIIPQFSPFNLSAPITEFSAVGGGTPSYHISLAVVGEENTEEAGRCPP